MHHVEHTRSGRETRDCLTSRRRNSWSEKYDLRYMLSYVGWVAFDWKSFAISRLRSLFVPRMRNYHSKSHNMAVSKSYFFWVSHRRFLRTEKRPAPADFWPFLAIGSPLVWHFSSRAASFVKERFCSFRIEMLKNNICKFYVQTKFKYCRANLETGALPALLEKV